MVIHFLQPWEQREWRLERTAPNRVHPVQLVGRHCQPGNDCRATLLCQAGVAGHQRQGPPASRTKATNANQGSWVPNNRRSGSEVPQSNKPQLAGLWSVLTLWWPLFLVAWCYSNRCWVRNFYLTTILHALNFSSNFVCLLLKEIILHF